MEGEGKESKRGGLALGININFVCFGSAEGIGACVGAKDGRMVRRIHGAGIREGRGKKERMGKEKCKERKTNSTQPVVCNP